MQRALASLMQSTEQEQLLMRIKIHRGTPVHDGDTLCNTCAHGRVTRGRSVNEELVVCEASHMSPTHITFKVTSCSSYQDQRVPSYWELMQQAWILQPESRRKPAGFVRASDLRDQDFGRYMSELSKHDEG